MEEDFDWMADTFDCEVQEQHFDKRWPKILTNRIFDEVFKAIIYICIALSSLLIIRFLFNFSKFRLFSIDLNVLLLSINLYLFLLIKSTYSAYFTLNILSTFISSKFYRRLEMTYRWTVLFFWFLIGLNLLKLYKENFYPIYFYTKRFFICGLLSSLILLSYNILFDQLYIYYIKKSLKNRLKETRKTEEIIKTFKCYLSENNELSECGYQSDIQLDLICTNLRRFIRLLNDRKIDQLGDLAYRQPELKNIEEAKSLAMNTFIKVSKGENELSFDGFSKIFRNKKNSRECFLYFDADSDGSISKREFKNAVIQFYNDRLNLERTIYNSFNFINTLSNFFFILIVLFLIICYLIIFGISLSKMVTLSLSSAVLINFTVSGIAQDFFNNILFILTHPFDIGDEITIDNKNFKVYKVTINTTTLIADNGGKIIMLNKYLRKKFIYNMTNSPDKLLTFNFPLKNTVSIEKINNLKNKIKEELKLRKYDFYPDFIFRTACGDCYDIDFINTSLVLRMRLFRSQSKRYVLRVEFTRIINRLLKKFNYFIYL